MIELKWKRDGLLTVIPVIGFAILFYFRHHHWTDLECAERACLSSDVFFLDRWVLETGGDLWAQRYSNLTQNMSAVFALTVLMIFHLGKPRNFGQWWVDLLLLIQATFWNLFVNETIRSLSQRARPYVYHDQGLAQDPSAYTSFYSGHTSFAAVACTIAFLVLKQRQAPKPLLWTVALVGTALIVSTAVLRVRGGQHFVTDVVFGAIAGIGIAFAVVRAPRT